VGTYYSAPEPGAPPYVSVGQRIQKSQVLCIIEAMKIMNEIASEFAGTVVEVLCEDAHPVEYGQVLFRIDPNGRTGYTDRTDGLRRYGGAGSPLLSRIAADGAAWRIGSAAEGRSSADSAREWRAGAARSHATEAE